MPKSTTPLTQSDINNLTCPAGRKSIQYPVDPHVPGLLIEIRDSGSKTYFLRYRDAQSQTRYAKIARAMDLTLAEVKKQALKLRSGIVLGTYPGTVKQEKQQCMTFAEFFEQKYIPFTRPRKRSWRDDEKLYKRRLRDLYGSIQLDRITRHSIQQMHSDLRSELSASSCDHHLGLMSRCLRLALDWKLITENPAQGLKKYNEDNRRDRLMNDEELQRLMSVLESDPARTPCLALKMALFTAARKGEILHMRWADISRQESTWTIQATNAKSKKRRIVPLNSTALAILDELAKGNDSEWVFRNSKNGERLMSVEKIWSRIRVKAALPADIVIHSLRHQAASMSLASGTDLATVRDLLGHANISTTECFISA